MRFESPWLLLLLLMVPLWWWFLTKNRKSQFVHFSGVGTLQSFARNSWWSHPLFLPAIRCLVLILLILTIARPQTGRSFSKILTEGVDIVLALDVSGSMRALDLKLNNERVTRLEVLKKVVGEFIENRLNDRVGIVVFGEEAFTQAPLTHDHKLLLGFLEQIFIGWGGDATAIGMGIGHSAKRLKDLKAPTKLIILATDGQNNAGHITPAEAARAAKDLGIKIYTIGVGSRGNAPIEVDSVFGKKIVNVPVSIDEETLTKIAETTGGRYFRATDTESLQKIYQTIDELEKTEVEVKEYYEYEEQYAVFLIPALLLFLLEFILARTRLRRLP
ncbi:MAG: VWA domain-containing protein [SAR324 cluster bacterium]|nr:VWA domain-containing protein [SAR324 cluster bacterium]